MPSAKYYREQAQTLLGWALATADKAYAAQLTARAMELLARSGEAEETPTGLHQAIAAFNDQQLAPARPAQQQQQAQPKKDKE